MHGSHAVGYVAPIANSIAFFSVDSSPERVNGCLVVPKVKGIKGGGDLEYRVAFEL